MGEAESLKNIVDMIMKCEAKLREMATWLQLEDAQGRTPQVYKFATDLRMVRNDLDQVIIILMHSAYLRLPYESEIREKVYDAYVILRTCKDVMDSLGRWITFCGLKGYFTRLGRNWWKPKYYPPDILEWYMPKQPTGWVSPTGEINIPNEMSAACRIAEERLGRRACMWDWINEPLASFAIILNDLATMIHRVAEMLSALGFAHRIADFAYTMNSHPAIRAAAIAFSDTVKRMYSLKLIAREDSGVQIAIARGYELTLRLGSAPGHGAHINIAQRNFVYYDEDDIVNQIIKRLLEELRITTARAIHGEGVRGYANENNAINIARVLACAISMDIRLGSPRMWSSALETIKEREPQTYNRLAEELATRYGIKGRDPIEVLATSINYDVIYEFLYGEYSEKIASDLEWLSTTAIVDDATTAIEGIIDTLAEVSENLLTVIKEWKAVATIIDKCINEINKYLMKLEYRTMEIEDVADIVNDLVGKCMDEVHSRVSKLLVGEYKVSREDLEFLFCKVIILRM